MTPKVYREKYYRNNIFEYGEELEPNENLDAYSVMKEFLAKLGSRTAKTTDVDSVRADIITLLEVVNMGVNLELTGYEAEIAEETVSILVDRETGRTTFQPLKTRDEFM